VRLKILLPTEILVDQEVDQVTAEAENGSFSMLPRHIDFVAALAPGLLSYVTTQGEEQFLAVDEGILVKCGAEVLVSTRNAVQGANLGELRDAVEKEFRAQDEHEKQARTAFARMEADLVRRFVEMEQAGHG
jgi:F-type H+-transporting ATPase subunit epsilon